MRKILSEKLEAFYRAESSDKKTLDIGSRKGRHSAHFPHAVTIDIDPKADPDVVADAHALPFADASFEIVLCREVLEHVKDPKIVLSEIYRVLQPGGTLLLSTRFLFPVHEAPNDRWRFTQFILKELFVGWSEVSIKAETRPFTALGCLLERIVWQSTFCFPNKIWKGVMLIVARILMQFDFLIVREYGDVTKSIEVDNAFTTGFYVKARK